MKQVQISVANHSHLYFAEILADLYKESAAQRGIGIAKRSISYLKEKIQEGKAIIALTEEGELAGFCYIETWSHDKFVANSGLLVRPEFRGLGLAKRIKAEAFALSRKSYPQAKIFGLTTSSAVLKINSELGYHPVNFSDLTSDEAFWKGCSSCKNYDVLTRTDKKHCLCTGMLYDPKKPKKKKWNFQGKARVFERLKRIKINTFFKKVTKQLVYNQ